MLSIYARRVSMQKSLKTVFFAFVSAILAACSNSIDPSDNSSDDSSKISEPAEEISSSSTTEPSSSSIMEESSSSHNKTSSSSTEISSSSFAKICKTESEDLCEYGSLTDERDGQTYKTVKIGEQWWMAENLNYTYLQPTADLDSSSFYYGNSIPLGHRYDSEADSIIEFPLKVIGRLYLWSAAMDSAGLWSTGSKGCGDGSKCTATFPVQGICPSGWHIPTPADFNTLISAAGGSKTAGTTLKSSVTTSREEGFWGEEGITLWSSKSNGNDAYGFSACPSGRRLHFGDYEGMDQAYGSHLMVAFWSSSEDDTSSAFYMGLGSSAYGAAPAGVSSSFKYLALSVRCIKD